MAFSRYLVRICTPGGLAEPSRSSATDLTSVSSTAWRKVEGLKAIEHGAVPLGLMRSGRAHGWGERIHSAFESTGVLRFAGMPLLIVSSVKCELYPKESLAVYRVHQSANWYF